MTRWTIDTNVPVAANGRDDQGRPVAIECRAAAVLFLMRVHDAGQRVVVDDAGAIEKEYRTCLNSSGQPGVGDRFYQSVLLDRRLCERATLPKRRGGEYADLPQAVIDAGFDRSDRVFAALAKREGIPVVNAVDSDWVEARKVLNENGIRVDFLCGCDAAGWFAER